jgi:hypothetical protein
VPRKKAFVIQARHPGLKMQFWTVACDQQQAIQNVLDEFERRRPSASEIMDRAPEEWKPFMRTVYDQIPAGQAATTFEIDLGFDRSVCLTSQLLLVPHELEFRVVAESDVEVPE